MTKKLTLRTIARLWAQAQHSQGELASREIEHLLRDKRWHQIPLEEWRPSDVRVIAEDWHRKGWGKGTINKRIAYLRAALRWAKREHLIDYAPQLWFFRDHRSHVSKYVRRETVYEVLEKVTNPVIRDCLEFTYLSARRIGEILPIKWKQVDDNAMVIHLSLLKKGDDRFALPISKHMARVLERRAEAAPKNRHPIWVFEHRLGRKLSYMNVWDAWRWAMGKTPHQFRIHDLRHSAITEMCKVPGISRDVIKAISGHKTDHIFDYYRHIEAGVKRPVLDAAFDPPELMPEEIPILKPSEEFVETLHDFVEKGVDPEAETEVGEEHERRRA